MFAARCITISAPRQTLLQLCGSHRSALSYSALPRNFGAILVGWLRKPRSTIFTIAPSLSKRSTKCEPMKPRPPVTTTFLFLQKLTVFRADRGGDEPRFSPVCNSFYVMDGNDGRKKSYLMCLSRWRWRLIRRCSIETDRFRLA